MSCTSIPEFWFMVASGALLCMTWLLSQFVERLVKQAKRLLAEANSLKAPQ